MEHTAAFGGPGASRQSLRGLGASIQSLQGTEPPSVITAPTPHGVGVKDPLLRRGSKALHDEKEDTAAQEVNITVETLWKRTLTLTFGCCIFYVFMATVVALFFDNWPFWVVLTLVITLAKSGLVWKFLVRRWLSSLGLFFAFGSLSGFTMGLYAYYSCLLPYLRYADSEKHTNVAAGEPALRFADAGMLTFSPGSNVDVTRAVGYMSAKAGARMCVAPVMDLSMGAQDPINFYAIGTNCCGWRGSFTCDDAGDPEARSALLELDMNTIVSPWTAWLWQDPVTSDGFQAALKLQEAVYGTKAAAHVRLLHWAREPHTMQHGYLTAAVQVIAEGLGLVALVSAIVGIYAAAGRVQFWKVVEFSQDGPQYMSIIGGSARFKKRAGKQKRSRGAFGYV